MAYDDTNIFARIIAGEIPCKKVFENTHALAFHDISPQMPVHVLVIPKGRYVTMDEFAAAASTDEQADLSRAIGEVARITGVAETGYRLIANNGEDAHQEVPHLHFHVLGGKRIGGRMIKGD